LSHDFCPAFNASESGFAQHLIQNASVNGFRDNSGAPAKAKNYVAVDKVLCNAQIMLSVGVIHIIIVSLALNFPATFTTIAHHCPRRLLPCRPQLLI
jgi:hypothetical protein